MLLAVPAQVFFCLLLWRKHLACCACEVCLFLIVALTQVLCPLFWRQRSICGVAQSLRLLPQRKPSVFAALAQPTGLRLLRTCPVCRSSASIPFAVLAQAAGCFPVASLLLLFVALAQAIWALLRRKHYGCCSGASVLCAALAQAFFWLLLRKRLVCCSGASSFVCCSGANILFAALAQAV